jgi:toxin-antitoxin system PIN domain toxin
MSAYLLDVNVLVALMWPAHESHVVAQAWFTRNREHKWATCPLTEAGFVRIVSNPAFSPQAVSPSQALEVFTASIAHPRHVFWPDDLSVAEALRPFRSKLTGHHQITDAYLLGLALTKKSVLVTFDRAILTLATGHAGPKHVQLIASNR